MFTEADDEEQKDKTRTPNFLRKDATHLQIKSYQNTGKPTKNTQKDTGYSPFSKATFKRF